jgi:hypothetical protein
MPWSRKAFVQRLMRARSRPCAAFSIGMSNDNELVFIRDVGRSPNDVFQIFPVHS